jgi:hypothetical protein
VYRTRHHFFSLPNFAHILATPSVLQLVHSGILSFQKSAQVKYLCAGHGEDDAGFGQRPDEYGGKVMFSQGPVIGFADLEILVMRLQIAELIVNVPRLRAPFVCVRLNLLWQSVVIIIIVVVVIIVVLVVIVFESVGQSDASGSSVFVFRFFQVVVFRSV